VTRAIEKGGNIVLGVAFRPVIPRPLVGHSSLLVFFVPNLLPPFPGFFYLDRLMPFSSFEYLSQGLMIG
jgi:hypothetical protein